MTVDMDTKLPARTSRRRVRFGTVSQVVYDGSLSPEEKDCCFHNPNELRSRTKQEVQLARRCFRTHSKPPANFVFRGLEKRLQSSDAQKRKWYSFLRSFLALQHDLRKLEGDVSNLLAVFVATHSKTDQATAYQMARQDEATAFHIYNAEGDQCTRLNLISGGSSAGEVPKLKPSNSKTNLRSNSKQGCHLARSA